MKGIKVTTDNIIEALQKGKEIRNPETWKNSTTAINAIASTISLIIGALALFGVNVLIPEEYLATAATWAWSAVGAFNVVSTLITSRKVGITLKKKE